MRDYTQSSFWSLSTASGASGSWILDTSWSPLAKSTNIQQQDIVDNCGWKWDIKSAQDSTLDRVTLVKPIWIHKKHVLGLRGIVRMEWRKVLTCEGPDPCTSVFYPSSLRLADVVSKTLMNYVAGKPHFVHPHRRVWSRVSAKSRQVEHIIRHDCLRQFASGFWQYTSEYLFKPWGEVFSPISHEAICCPGTCRISRHTRLISTRFRKR